jgi:hypothetical protein
MEWQPAQVRSANTRPGIWGRGRAAAAGAASALLHAARLTGKPASSRTATMDERRFVRVMIALLFVFSFQVGTVSRLPHPVHA